MSLINQMLQDLEKRSRPSVNPEISLSGLFTSEVTERRKNKPLIFGMVLILIVLLLISFHKHIFHKKKLSTPIVAAVVVPPKVIQKTTPTPILENNKPNPVIAGPSVLTGITLQTQQDITSLRFLLNQDTFYIVDKDEKNNLLKVVLRDTNLIADLPPIDYIKTAIKNLEIANDPQGNLVILITLNPGAQVQHLDVSKDKSPELQIDVLAGKVEQPVMPLPKEQKKEASNDSFIKKPVDEFNIEQQYKDAYNFALIGQKDVAINMLTGLLESHPNYHAARELLVNLFLEQGSTELARKILQVGLAIDPGYSPFIEIQAQMFIKAGKLDQALELLQSAAPPIEKNPNYHAFIAALYQRQGQSMLAARLYEQLLSIEPNKAIWWMGLGIALESQGEESEAKEAYLHANNASGLSPELRAFVQTRINNI